MKDLLLQHGVVVTTFTSSFGRLRQNNTKSVTHVQHDYSSLFNQSDHWFVALQLPSSFLKLANSS